MGSATLELIDAAHVPLDQYGNATSWQASILSGGSPGLPTEVRPSNPGDLNGDERVTSDDIDWLCQAILAGNSAYDLNGDQQVDLQDLYHFVQATLGTAVGDANLDGVFDSGDFVLVFQQGEYEDQISGNSTWAAGDWNCDGEFDTSDLVVAFQFGNYVPGARIGRDEAAENGPANGLSATGISTRDDPAVHTLPCEGSRRRRWTTGVGDEVGAIRTPRPPPQSGRTRSTKPSVSELSMNDPWIPCFSK